MKNKISALLTLILTIMILAAGCKASQSNDTSDDNPATTVTPAEGGNIVTVSPTVGVTPTAAPTLSPEEAQQKQLNDALDTISIPNANDIRGNITLCKSVNTKDASYDVTWSSSDESILTSTATGDTSQIAAGVVTRGEQDAKVVLTAEIAMNGTKATKEFPLTVKAKSEEKSFGAYLYCYFQDNIAGKGQTQQIFFATSKDGLRWKSLNEDQPVLISTMGTKGVRDPFLLRSKDGDKFYILATDLDANGGDWGAYSTNGSRNIVIWESDDLVNWSEERLVDISPRQAECMWAPEAYYDDATGEYVVYWSASVSGGNGKKIYYAKTRDFCTFTQPKIYKDVERNAKNIKNGNGKIEANLTFIDTTMIEYNNVFYRFTKREIDQSILMDSSDNILGPFTEVKDLIAGEKGVEGPSIFQLIGQEKWILMVDGYAGKGYFPLMADSPEKLETGHFVRVPKSQYQMPKGARHGSFMSITQEEYDALTAKWGN